jgi:hypothetical protein
MKKIKYLFNIIRRMNFNNFFNYVNKVHERNKKNKLLIIIDMIYCGLVYQSGYVDYDLFKMDEMNRKQRKTVVTRGINNQFVKYFNNMKNTNLFLNKILFNERFNSFLKREWIVLNDNADDFYKFLENKEYIIAKPTSGTCGKGIEKILVKDFKDKKELFDYLISKNLFLIEEMIIQDERISKLYPHAINTIRMITLSKNNKSTILAAYLRIGNNKRFVDNFNSGGMVVPIDIKTGIIKYPALDKNSILYESHPETNTNIIGFQIPDWNEIVSFGKELALVIDDMGMIGWDISLSNKGPLVVEGNEYPGHDIYQLPPHRTNNIGMLLRFYEALSEIGLTKKDIK